MTPDSFYKDSRTGKDDLLRKVEKMLHEGASIIDVGGYSTRPGAIDISVNEELKRVIPAIEEIKNHFPELPVSIDTFRSKVAEESVQAGACMINDISGGQMDDQMFETVARYQVPYVLTHIQGTPATMQENPRYKDVVLEINRFFARKIKQLHALGVNDIIIDPGFGFGKTLEHNYEILKKLEYFQWNEKPLLVGVSRKSMLYKLLQGKPAEMLNATSVVHTIALMKKASILRVHDVKEAVEAVRIVMQLEKV